MDPINPISRTIGLVLGVAIVGAVGTVTFVSERSAPSAPLTQTNSSVSASPSTSTSSVVASTPVATSVRSGENESGEDDGGSRSSLPANNTPQPMPAPAASVPPATVPKQTAASVYKDGTYSATGSYMSPGGYEQIAITLTIKNDIITSVSATPMAGDRTSQRYQSYFVSGYQQYVVGQNIASVNLTYVSGSSLTPIGFNDALSQIKTQAKA